jgi:flagellar biosynthesis protein FlhB
MGDREGRKTFASEDVEGDIAISQRDSQNQIFFSYFHLLFCLIYCFFFFLILWGWGVWLFCFCFKERKKEKKDEVNQENKEISILPSLKLLGKIFGVSSI